MTEARGDVPTVLVGGHESAQGTDLAALGHALPGVLVARPGRALHDAVSGFLTRGQPTVAVLPMTWGRDPVMVAETAKTLRWLTSEDGRGRVALCSTLGTPAHLVAWLRHAATLTARRSPHTTLILAAHAANPFDDAELYRLAHLVRVHGAVGAVEVACVQDARDVDAAVERARVLGADDVVVVPAGFERGLPAEVRARVSFFGPLVSDQALVRVVRDRVADVVHELRHGDDGIDAGLLADHGHGYAHSHAFEAESESGAGSGAGSGEHPRSHAHPHAHPHTPGHRQVQAHGVAWRSAGEDLAHSETPSVHGASPVEA